MSYAIDQLICNNVEFGMIIQVKQMLRTVEFTRDKTSPLAENWVEQFLDLSNDISWVLIFVLS
jgi:hypothetical protein